MYINLNVDGDWIKKLREDSGLTYQHLSNVLAVAPQTITKWESNQSSPSQLQLATLIRLRDKVDEERNLSKSKDEISKNIKALLITGGILGLFFWLFNSDK